MIADMTAAEQTIAAPGHTPITNPPRPSVARLADIEPITWSGKEAARFLLRAEDTGGRFSYYQVVVPAGEGSLLHLHKQMDETFHVVDGEFEIVIGPDAYNATAGTVVYGPRGIAHSFRNVGDREGTMLCVTTPGGIERFFEELSLLIHSVPPPQWSQLHELAARHQIVAFKPETGHLGPGETSRSEREVQENE